MSEISPNPMLRRVRHRKRGTTYVVLGIARVVDEDENTQASYLAEGHELKIFYDIHGEFKAVPPGLTPVHILESMVFVGIASLQVATEAYRPEDGLLVYSGEGGELWARSVQEFNDGRFEELDAVPWEDVMPSFLQTSPPFIAAVALRVVKDGYVFSLPRPARHQDVATYSRLGDVDDDTKGFLTDHGKWVDRLEALSIAEKAGQLIRPAAAPVCGLFSEDIW